MSHHSFVHLVSILALDGTPALQKQNNLHELLLLNLNAFSLNHNYPQENENADYGATSAAGMIICVLMAGFVQYSSTSAKILKRSGNSDSIDTGLIVLAVQ